MTPLLYFVGVPFGKLFRQQGRGGEGKMVVCQVNMGDGDLADVCIGCWPSRFSMFVCMAVHVSWVLTKSMLESRFHLHPLPLPSPVHGD